MLHHAAPLAADGRFFGAVRATGAHRASVAAVASGAADLAAIDLVSLGLARRFVPAAGRLRVLFLTDPTPGLPLIAAQGSAVAPHRRAVVAAVAALDAGTRGALGIHGFVALGAEAWAIVGKRHAAARAVLNDALARAG